MSELCREFGISRKTGYKYKDRFEKLGPEGLFDASRKPKRSPNRLPPEICELLLAERRARPTWGPRKIRKIVGDRNPGVKMPARSTIYRLFKREGLVQPQRRRRRTLPYTQPLKHARAPNDLWCIDFKGQFRMRNGRYCYPLTITDAYSRYLLGCEALESTHAAPAQLVVQTAFEQYGLPKNIRSDNGTPFASTGVFGLTTLSAWWTALGVNHERIEPSHPEQNGRHERMHRTLKRETTRPPGSGMLAQQERFDAFRDEFNQVRPHQALDDEVPGSVYTASTTRYRGLEQHYPLHDFALQVSDAGHVHPPSHSGMPSPVYLGRALRGLRVGLREIDEGWLVSLGQRDLGWLLPDSTMVEAL